MGPSLFLVNGPISFETWSRLSCWATSHCGSGVAFNTYISFNSPLSLMFLFYFQNFSFITQTPAFLVSGSLISQKKNLNSENCSCANIVLQIKFLELKKYLTFKMKFLKLEASNNTSSRNLIFGKKKIFDFHKSNFQNLKHPTT